MGIQEEDMKRFTLFILCASSANSIPAVFWMIYNILSRDGVWETIREEVVSISSQKKNKSSPFTSQELDRMVGLHSTFSETLRLASSFRVLRDVTEDFEFDLKLDSSKGDNKYFVQRGSIVVGFTPQLHKDEDVFPDADRFQWDRFLPNNSSGEPVNFFKHGQLVNDPMRAFGGGAHLCPGRKFIANEVKAVVATLVTNCDVRLLTNETIAPDMWRQGAGIPQPDKAVKIQIRLSESKQL
jgi:cytochrome P450